MSFQVGDGRPRETQVANARFDVNRVVRRANAEETPIERAVMGCAQDKPVLGVIRAVLPLLGDVDSVENLANVDIAYRTRSAIALDHIELEALLVWSRRRLDTPPLNVGVKEVERLSERSCGYFCRLCDSDRRRDIVGESNEEDLVVVVPIHNPAQVDIRLRIAASSVRSESTLIASLSSTKTSHG